jgi:glycosyltransferase involved in cell wall biosynthesis
LAFGLRLLKRHKVGSGGYVLITPARNEEAYIEKTIQAVISQTILPEKWIIASDRSTDRTDDIVAKYANEWDFLELLRVEGDNERNFGSKVRAIHKAASLLAYTHYEFIGNLDADISFGSDYFESILDKFRDNSRLGIAGGSIYEEVKGEFIPRPFNGSGEVPNAVQLFRRECYEQTGGLVALRYGGEDSYSEVIARAAGWEVESFPGIKVFHHRRTLGAEGLLKGGFRQGKMDYDLGSCVLFELLKCIARAKVKPYGLYSGYRFAGFISSYIAKEQRGVPREFIKKLRSEQYGKIKNIFSDRENVGHE